MSIILRPYQNDIIIRARSLFKNGTKSILIQSPTGCVSGDTTIRLNRCKKGYARTIEKEYKLQGRYDKKFKTKIRGLNGSGFGVSLVDLSGGISHSGFKSCIKLTSNSRYIKLTPDHLVWTKKGWTPAKDMLGREWAVDNYRATKAHPNIKKCRNRDSYLTNISHHPFAVLVNSRRDGPYKKIEMHRAIYEAHVNNMSYQQYVNILRNGGELIKNMWFMDTSKFEIHHINWDHSDNSVGNLTHLTIAEHLSVHAGEFTKNFNQGTFTWEKVISIEDVGELEVFDACGSETSSFTANDIVVHNSGKTALTAHMIKTSASRGLRPWFVVHRRELVKQSADSFNNAEVDYGILASGFSPDPTKPVQICNIGSIRSRMSLYQPPDFIVFDECHHQSAGTWSKLFDQFPNAFKIGLTATPQRLDGSGLDKFYEQMINGPSVRWLIDNGFLSDYKLFVPGNPDLSKVHTRMGDYVKSELISMFDKPTITGSAINEYNKRAAGKRAVVFAISIEHSKHIVDQFNCSGINAAHIDGETPANVRDQTIQMFRSGEIKVLSNVDIVGEGFDLPAIECAILLRPTKSLGLYLQQVGRSLRPSPDKLHAVILDHVGNCIQHGLPDAERIWTLRGREKKAKNQSSEPPIKVCKFCFAAQPPASTICKICGHAFETTPRQVDQVEGDLVEYDPSKMKSKRLDEQRRAQTLNELISIGKSRGMKHPYGWAKHVWNARQLKKLRGG